MARTKAQIKASDKYNKENTTSFLLRMNFKTDADVINHLEKQESKRGYILELIREDIKKTE